MSHSSLALILVIVATAACGGGTLTLEETAQVYERDVLRARRRASSVVFVPGILGSELHDERDGDVAWGTFWSSESWDDQLKELSLPWGGDRPFGEIRDHIVPGGELMVVDLNTPVGTVNARAYPAVFEGLVASLVAAETHGHPEALSIDALEEGRDPIVGFGYDWRRDMASEAERLHEVLLAASEERRLRTGRTRVDVIGHSMGTQLLRWYLRYGTAPVPSDDSLPPVTWEGARLVQRAILAAPPNLGEAQVLEVLLEGAEQHPLLPTYPPTLLATFPAVFELLPRPGDGRVVYADTREPVDLYDVEVWVRYGWGPFDEDADAELETLMPHEPTRPERVARLRVHMEAVLKHAERFHRALDVPAEPPPELDVHLFVSDAHPTRAVLLVDRETGERSWAEPEPGDGSVTRRGALGQSPRDRTAEPTVRPRSVHFLQGEHLPLVAEPSFIDDALYLLLEAEDPPEPH